MIKCIDIRVLLCHRMSYEIILNSIWQKELIIQHVSDKMDWNLDFDDNQLHEQFSFNVNIHIDLISFMIINLGLDIIIWKIHK
jgi:hypothetical protein